MEKLGEKEIELNGKKISGESIIRFNLKTLGWIAGILYALIGWAYWDLRKELKAATEISKEEKHQFLDDVEDKYDGKFEEMLREIYVIKGDIKVILDRENRTNPIQPNPNASLQPNLPPPNN